MYIYEGRELIPPSAPPFQSLSAWMYLFKLLASLLRCVIQRNLDLTLHRKEEISPILDCFVQFLWTGTEYIAFFHLNLLKKIIKTTWNGLFAVSNHYYN